MLCAITLGVSAPVSAQSDAVKPSADIAAMLEPIIQAHDVPGMVGAIVEGDGTLSIGCAGVRQSGEPEKITVFDKMHIGSCTKSMTATMIATLVQDGKLSWETTIGEVFGDLDGKMNPVWRDVTLRLLLTNRSGAPGDLIKTDLWQRLYALNRTESPGTLRAMLVEGVLTQPPEAPPGEKYIYSNAGFALAGAMAEKVTGESYENLMRARLFKPLKMKSAGFGAPGSALNIDQPRGHRASGESVQPDYPGADNPIAIAPAGLVHCSVIDWSKYIALHLQGAQGKGTLILKADAFAALHDPALKKEDESAPDYAMGWSIARRGWAGDGGRALTHNGSNTMWFAVTWLAPAKDFAVLIACNKGGAEAEKACDEAAAALIQHHQRDQLRWP